jgi:DNA-binding GntR family transcriptional regulator
MSEPFNLGDLKDPTKSWHRSAADSVTSQLRRELLDGTIPAGSRILPKGLASRFSLSIVPIREALRHLEAEGLVATTPQRATYAADIGVDELGGVYDLRRVVEPEFAARAARIASDADRKACMQAYRNLKEVRPHSPEFYAAHRDFHWSLLSPAAMPVIRKVLERLWQSVDRYMALGVRRLPEHSSPEFIRDFHKEHETIAKAFNSGDAEYLSTLLVEHFNRTEAAMRLMLTDFADRTDVADQK